MFTGRVCRPIIASTRKSATGGFDELPEIARVRLGGLTAVMTMISFLLVSTAGVFGYRSMFGGG